MFGSLKKTRKITGFRALYFHYCYLLGIFPKNKPKQNRRRLHFLLREDLRKLDDITAETRLLVRNRIDTAEQLFSYRDEAQDKIAALTAERKQLYKLQRTAAVKADPEKSAEIKDRISALSKELATLRKEVSLCDDIAERSGVIKEKTKPSERMSISKERRKPTMYNSGDAAEQIVRISLEGTEVALKLTGSAAKNIAAMIYTVLKNRDKNKTKGRQRLTAMLKSGKELKVFTVSEEHLKQFAAEAKRYGVVYCALRGKEKSADGMVDIMVRAEDASKINRIVERFKLATVDTVSIKRDIEQSKADKTAPSAPEQEKPDKAADDRLLDDLLGAPVQKEEHTSPNPAAAKTEKSRPSAPTSEKQNRTAEGTAKSPEERPSVREELREIRESRQKEAAEPGISEPTPAKEPKKQPATTHKQPSRKKPKKAKER